MKLKIIDLTGKDEFSYFSNVDNIPISDVLRDDTYSYLVFLLNQNQVEVFCNLLTESVFDVKKISTWIKSGISSHEIYYSSKSQKNCCSFIFWLGFKGKRFPKNIIRNFYIEDKKNPDWLKEALNEFKLNDIEIDLFSTSEINIENIENKYGGLF